MVVKNQKESRKRLNQTLILHQENRGPNGAEQLSTKAMTNDFFSFLVTLCRLVHPVDK